MALQTGSYDVIIDRRGDSTSPSYKKGDVTVTWLNAVVQKTIIKSTCNTAVNMKGTHLKRRPFLHFTFLFIF